MDRVRLNLTRRTNGSSEDAGNTSSKSGTKKRTQTDAPNGEERNPKRVKTDGDAKEEAESSAEQPFEQSVMVSGTTLKDYQLEGVAWMAGLHRAGMSGILGAYPSESYAFA